jgi:YidC/Oxa1 family membrane protein insertase
LRPEMDKIKETIEDKTEQSKAIMELYKKNGANPFSGCLPVLLQIPIILALYQAFIGFAAGKPDLLYSTLQLSQNFTAMMGGVDLFQKSILVALLAGLTQYAQLSMSPVQVDDKDPQAGMQKTLRLTMPVMITFFAAALPAAVALYWATSNVVTLIMERVVRARLH